MSRVLLGLLLAILSACTVAAPGSVGAPPNGSGPSAGVGDQTQVPSLSISTPPGPTSSFRDVQSRAQVKQAILIEFHELTGRECIGEREPYAQPTSDSEAIGASTIAGGGLAADGESVVGTLALAFGTFGASDTGLRLKGMAYGFGTVGADLHPDVAVSKLSPDTLVAREFAPVALPGGQEAWFRTGHLYFQPPVCPSGDQ